MKKKTKAKKSALKLLDFTATWCGPCQSMKPILKKFEKAHPEVKVVVIDVDRNEPKCRKYGITCMPTFVLERDGEVLASRSGACALAELNRFVEGR